MKRDSSVLVADFETTTDPNDCRVWATGVAPVGDNVNVEITNSIDSFIAYVSARNATIYFHNLRFDGHFIIDYLFRHAYAHIAGNSALKPGHFRIMMSDMGKLYSIVVYWQTGMKTEFRDSLKKLPMSVKEVGKAFQLADQKGELDYKKYRPPGHIITEEEKEYLRKDVQIIASAMAIQLNQGLTRLTIGSDALREYKEIVSTNEFRSQFPVMSLVMDSEMRQAYRGGFTYADERFSKRITGKGIVLDVNSLYPYIMLDRMLPYGWPIYQRGMPVTTPEYPLSIFSVTFTAKLKEGFIPCIQIKGSMFFKPTEYVKEIPEPTTMYVTNVDWELYNEHYDIHVLEYNGGWRMRGQMGMFDAYIDKWSKIKENSEGGLRLIAKLFLNSLYGKFATNPNVTGKIPTLEDNKVKFKTGLTEYRDPVYTPVGIFITSWARDYTIRSAQANYDTFAYADTDSLHLLQTEIPDGIDVHPARIGAWKLEYEFKAAKYLRAKAYIELTDHPKYQENGGYVTHIAGMPEEMASKLRFSDLMPGNTFYGKLTPKSVPGGVVLQETTFKLNF